MIISSFFEGRVRLKSNMFKNDEITREIEDFILLSGAVENISINKITGSMLIEYNPIKLPMLKIKKALPYLEKIKDIYDNYGDSATGDIKQIVSEMKILFK